MGEDSCKTCGVGMAHGYGSSYCDSCGFYMADKYGYVYEPSRVDPYHAHKETEDRLRRAQHEAEQAAKRKRLEAASTKECSGCGKHSWHDADDYICIVCRDGRDALPDGAHMPGVDAAA